MPEVATIAFFHAHPDDEAIATGGTMAGLSEAGHRVVLVTATRGELGEIPDGLLDEGESLADRRLAELTEACRVLGVERQVYLDYLDSGMAGEETNDRPGSFAAADIDEAARALSDILDRGGRRRAGDLRRARRVRSPRSRAGAPGGHAGRGPGRHPGGLHGHHEPRLHGSLADRVESSDWEPPEGSTDGMETMGEPADRLTTEVDVTRWLDHKRRAMSAHASQISEESFFLAMPPDVFSMVWGASGTSGSVLPWGPPAGQPVGDGLLLEGLESHGATAVTPTHRVLRVHGGRLVVSRAPARVGVRTGCRRGRGLRIVNSFAVDDNVYLVLHRPTDRRGRGPAPGAAQDSVNAWMDTTRLRPDSLAR